MVEIKTQVEDNIALIVINGDIDASSSIQLDASLKEQLENKHAHVVIDCTNLNYISSAGLGVFMSYIEEFNATKQKFALFGLSDKVASVFEMLGLDQLMNIIPTKSEALAFLNEE